MPALTALPDEATFDCPSGDTVLSAALSAGLPIAHACGGNGRCSTCRIWVLAGGDDLPAREGAEAMLAERLRLDDHIRLACQVEPTAALRFRRLVLDDLDEDLTSHLMHDGSSVSGELRRVAVFFSDVVGFTTFSETLTPYDVMHILNRYFAQTGAVIEANGGYIDKFIGDGTMAIFGMNDASEAPLRAVRAGLGCLAAVDALKPQYQDMYGIDFDVRIGIHYGDAVIGSLGSPGRDHVTAVGNVVNVASRVEAANKEAGTRLLITEDLHDEIKRDVETEDFLRVRLRGAAERTTLYEIARLSEAAEARLSRGAEESTNGTGSSDGNA